MAEPTIKYDDKMAIWKDLLYTLLDSAIPATLILIFMGRIGIFEISLQLIGTTISFSIRNRKRISKEWLKKSLIQIYGRNLLFSIIVVYYLFHMAKEGSAENILLHIKFVFVMGIVIGGLVNWGLYICWKVSVFSRILITISVISSLIYSYYIGEVPLPILGKYGTYLFTTVFYVTYAVLLALKPLTFWEIKSNRLLSEPNIKENEFNDLKERYSLFSTTFFLGTFFLIVGIFFVIFSLSFNHPEFEARSIGSDLYLMVLTLLSIIPPALIYIIGNKLKIYRYFQVDSLLIKRYEELKNN